MLHPSDNASEPLVLSGDLTVREAQAIHARLSAGLSGAKTTVVSFGDVDRVDLSFLQLVLAARLSAAATGGTLRLARPVPAAIDEAARRAGLVEAFAAAEGDEH